MSDDVLQQADGALLELDCLGGKRVRRADIGHQEDANCPAQLKRS
jgi:hypothetical protein